MPEGGEGTVYFDKQIYLINHVSADDTIGVEYFINRGIDPVIVIKTWISY
jgi:hypothetical protein